MAFSRLSQELYNQAKFRAGKWTQFAKQYLFSSPVIEPGGPKRLDIRINSTVERLSAQRFVIKIHASGKNAHTREWGGDYAKAYEYGSGIHSQAGERDYYAIKPRKKKALAFYWERAYEHIPRLPDGRVIFFNGILHPGVVAANEGQGYIRPALTELKVKYDQNMKASLRNAIRYDFNSAFKHARLK